jgi:hypothetical protein
MFFLFGPMVQLLGCAALLADARETRSQDTPRALNVRSLLIHAVVFSLVCISFVHRLRPLSDFVDEHYGFMLRDWYRSVG